MTLGGKKLVARFVFQFLPDLELSSANISKEPLYKFKSHFSKVFIWPKSKMETKYQK